MPQPVMVVSGGQLRAATDTEASSVHSHEVVARELRRLPGRGRDALSASLTPADSSGFASAQGYLINCSCGHLFLDDLPNP